MSEISQVGAFDAEIIETSRRIERLVQEHAPYTQIEDEQYKLSTLMNQKRQGLYQAKDPSYYVDQFIRCLSAEDRRTKAAELAEGALASINAILESDDQIADPSQFETFTSVVEFFRYFAPKDEAAIYDSDTTDEDDVPRSRCPHRGERSLQDHVRQSRPCPRRARIPHRGERTDFSSIG